MTSTQRIRHQGTWGPVQTIPERTTVRHGLAEEIELGRAAGGWDSIAHPFTNWGYANALSYKLANLGEHSRIKTAG